MSLNAKGITLTSLASDMEKLNLISLYEAFHEGLEALEEAWENLQQVDVKYGSSAKYKTGKAIITSLSANSASKEKTTYSVSLQGVGALTRN
jgi:hypothetical protein